jgi:hypothetical protein
MKQQPYNLNREFIKWFYEDAYPHDLSNRAMVAKAATNADIDTIDYFMRQAFKSGAQKMANETLCVLGDWACAAEGLEPELITPSEVFDTAEENLDYYYKRLFGDKNES